MLQERDLSCTSLLFIGGRVLARTSAGKLAGCQVKLARCRPRALQQATASGNDRKAYAVDTEILALTYMNSIIKISETIWRYGDHILSRKADGQPYL